MVLNPDVLIYLAGGSFVLGYLIINQVGLRLMLLAGTVLYILYYATVATDPLWGAIYTSVATGTANLIGLVALFLRRSGWAIPRAHRDLYGQFAHLPPGDFRALMRRGHRHRTTGEEVLTTEGALVSQLSYVISGTARVTKRGESFDLPPGVFVGEVAYMLRRPSAATTVLPAGSELVTWDAARLRRAAARSPRFKLTLEAAISLDMAAKVALAVAPGDMRENAEPAFDTGAAADRLQPRR